MSNFTEQRAQMVEKQLKARGIQDARVLSAIGEVPRERFVPTRHHDLSYEDAPLPIEEGQTISQPYIVALMIEAAKVVGAPPSTLLQGPETRGAPGPQAVFARAEPGAEVNLLMLAELPGEPDAVDDLFTGGPG